MNTTSITAVGGDHRGALGHRGAGRWVLPLVVGVLVALAAGCRTSVRVDVAQDGTGGGTVSVVVDLDADMVEAFGGMESVATDDLTPGGWLVGIPEPSEDGSQRVEATRAFADGAQLQTVLDQIAGDGVFDVVVSDVDSGLARTSHRLSVDVMVTGDPGQFSDDALTQTLGGLPLGRTADELVEAGVTEPGSATMTVAVEVPGGVLDEAEFDLTSGGPTSSTVSSEGTDYDFPVIVTAVAGLALVVFAAVLGILALIRFRRARRARRTP